MKKMALLLLSILMIGCSNKEVASLGHDFDAEKRFEIKKKISTKDELIKLLGEPTNKIVYDNELEEWVYEYAVLTQKQKLIAQNKIPWAHDKKLVIFFNGQGVAADYIYTEDKKLVSNSYTMSPLVE